MKASVLERKGKPLLVYRGEKALGGKELKTGQYVQPYSPRAARRLTKAGYEVGSLEAIYDYPGPYEKPRDCQREMVRMGVKHKRFFNLSEMRTGKTNGTIWMLDIRMRYMGLKRSMIIAPLTTILKPWRTDIFDTLPHLSVYYATKSASDLKKAIESGHYSMIVMNPAKLTKVIDELIEWDPQYVVVDEMMEFKAESTTQYAALEDLMTSPRGKYRGFLPLSGTLGAQSPTDIWTSARFINPACPGSYPAFKGRVLYKPDPQNKYLTAPVEGAEEYVAELLQPSVRFRTDDVNDMPEHERFSERVEMGKEQARMFKEMKKEFITQDGDGSNIVAANAAVKLWKLLQIANGAVYSDMHNPVICGAPGKIERLLQMMAETPDKTVIMSGWKCQQRYIAEAMVKKGYKPQIIDGKITGKARQQVIDDFQYGECQPVICHPRTTKHGIDLSAGSLLVFFGPRTSTEEVVQGSARIRRPGTGKTAWCELSCTDLEEKWFRIVRERKLTQERIVDLYRETLAA